MTTRGAAIEIAPGVYRIPTLGDYINTVMFVEADGSVCLVDAGLKRAPARIVAGLAAIGKHPADVRRIVLTHAHYDHTGGAAQMVRKCGLAGVAVHERDAGFVERGERPPIDGSTLGGKTFARLSRGGFEPVEASECLSDGQLLDVAGGLRVHHTPGHTPGHVSLLHEPSGVLITGDAIFNMASRMIWPVAAFCASHRQNQRTAHVLGELEYEVAVFTHGPHIAKNAREAVRRFLRHKHAW